MRTIFLLPLLVLLTACGQSYRDTSVEMVTVTDLDRDRYLGLWYEIARFPVVFQRGCVATTAEYALIDEDTVSVLNTCREETTDGPVNQIEGRADIVGPGKLEVKFDGMPFFVRGDYWVLWVDEGYETAVVGTPSGRAGWILARTPEISEETRAEANDVLAANGYDTTALIEVPQPPG